jgi:hypothetical protein
MPPRRIRWVAVCCRGTALRSRFGEVTTSALSHLLGSLGEKSGACSLTGVFSTGATATALRDLVSRGVHAWMTSCRLLREVTCRIVSRRSLLSRSLTGSGTLGGCCRLSPTVYFGGRKERRDRLQVSLWVTPLGERLASELLAPQLRIMFVSQFIYRSSLAFF